MADDPRLELIRKFESGGQNIPNYMFDPTHTAQGYYQITNQNWNNIAPKLGIDTKKFPNAMSASEDDQKKVAAHMLSQPDGIRNWTDYNPKLKAALDEGGSMPQEQDYSNMTNQQLLDLAKKDPNLSKRLVSTEKTSDKKSTLTVKPPEKGWFEKWATSPQSLMTNIMQPSQGAIKQFTRGAMGYEPPGSEWQDQALDMLRGGEKALAPAAIASLLPAGIPAALTSLGLGGAGGLTAETMGRSAAPEISKNPKTQDLIAEGSGLGGAILAGWGGPKLLKNPAGRAALGALTAHAMGGGAATDLIVGLLSGGGEYLPGRLGQMFRGAREAFTPTDFGTKGKGAPATGKVESPAAVPTKPLPKTSVEDDMLKTGSLTPDQYVARMKEMGMDEGMAKAKMQHAIKTHLQEVADKAAKNQPPEPKSPVTLKPAPIDQTRTATTVGGTPTNVRTLPGTQVIPNLPVGPPPLGPPASGTGPGLQITPSAPAPEPPPAPGSLGTVGPLPPNVQGPPLTGPAATDTGIQPNLGATPPAQAPPNLGTVGPLSPMPPRPPISTTVPERTPLGNLPGPSLQQKAISIADAAEKIGRAPSIVMNKATRAKWIKELGFDPTSEEISEGRRVYKERQRAKEPTAKNP